MSFITCWRIFRWAALSFFAGLTCTNARVEGCVLFFGGGFGIAGAFWTLNLISIVFTMFQLTGVKYELLS